MAFPQEPKHFGAVGTWYGTFDQITDEDFDRKEWRTETIKAAVED